MRWLRWKVEACEENGRCQAGEKGGYNTMDNDIMNNVIMHNDIMEKDIMDNRPNG